MKLFKKAKEQKVELSKKAREVLDKSAKAMNGAFGKVQRKAIRVAPYVALAVPGGIALSKYFTAYNHLLDAQAAHGNLLAVGQTAEQLKADIIELLPYTGRSRDEIMAMAGENYDAVMATMNRAQTELDKVFNTEVADAFHESLLKTEAVRELHTTFGFESPEALQAACNKNEVLAESVAEYSLDLYQDHLAGFANQLPNIQSEIVFNSGLGSKFEVSVNHPYAEQAMQHFNEIVGELNDAQLDAQIGTVMLAATAAVGAGIYAAKKVTEKRKGTKQSKAPAKEQEIER